MYVKPSCLDGGYYIRWLNTSDDQRNTMHAGHELSSSPTICTMIANALRPLPIPSNFMQFSSFHMMGHVPRLCLLVPACPPRKHVGHASIQLSRPHAHCPSLHFHEEGCEHQHAANSSAVHAVPSHPPDTLFHAIL